MRRTKRKKRTGVFVLTAAVLWAALMLFVCCLLLSRSLQAGRAEEVRPAESEAEQEISTIYKPEYLDKSTGLYRYNDPETGIYSMVGIDVSQHQSTLDWSFWKNSGLDFVFIRAGLRGYGTGALVEDDFYRTNLEQAQAVGMKCGVYFYSQAISAEEAREEADFVLELLGGVPLEMPVVFDWEIPATADARTWELPEETIRDCAAAFCEEIREGGYTPMLYANGGTYHTYRQDARLDEVDIWYAQYTEGEIYADAYSIWQYTQTGTVNGSGHIDLNLAYLNREGELLSAADLAALQG